VKEEKESFEINSAAVTDRGLNERRPVNEDAYFADKDLRLFVVADGVGGAQAGEVASQTAIEVISEAFRHQRAGEDVEELMEIAIQRANQSIYRMAREHPQFASMATTIVALYLDGTRATIGHVGDSRLYLIAPDGHIYRETQDHSVVEDEVRAGRLTPEEALRHPGRNIINRALGAESNVEVDLKTIEVQEGSTFLLCSDGITRHISDGELEGILSHAQNLQAACETLKMICYERGAEDNLTAVVVRVGEMQAASDAASAPQFDEDETTITAVRPAFAAAAASGIVAAAPNQNVAAAEVARESPTKEKTSDSDSTTLTSAPGKSRVTYFAEDHSLLNADLAPPRRGVLSSLLMGIIAVLIVGGFGALAFYLGTMNPTFFDKYLKRDGAPNAAANSAPIAASPNSSEAAYEQRRREVDRAPGAAAKQFEQEANGKPLDSQDPQFLYLYGRALLLSGRTNDARQAFDKSLALIGQRAGTGRDSLKTDASLAAAAAALKSGDATAMQTASKTLDEVVEKQP
jgi:serine/threonine protein phosphatase PrpC